MVRVDNGLADALSGQQAQKPRDGTLQSSPSSRTVVSIRSASMAA